MTMATKDSKAARAAKPEKMVNDAPRSFRDAEWPVGSVAHQGDVILVRIAALPKPARPRANRQVAEGNTQGSRHVLHGGAIYDCDPAQLAQAINRCCPKAYVGSEYLGPAFTTDEATALRHPEHGDHEYEDGMCVAVVFQRNLDAEERAVRSQD
jgi:hypothetical protein